MERRRWLRGCFTLFILFTICAVITQFAQDFIADRRAENLATAEAGATTEEIAVVEEEVPPTATDEPEPAEEPEPTTPPEPTNTLAPTDTPEPTSTPGPTDTPAPTRTSIPSATPLATRWFDGGTLHDATVAEWREAEERNQLATAADWVVVLDNDVPASELQPRATELTICTNTAIDGVEGLDESPAREIALVCALQLGYVAE